jgi:hypothetical protein
MAGSNPTAWSDREVASIGFIIYSTEAAAKDGVIDARNYGVVGDGTTDTRAAFEAACAAAEAAGKPLYLPAGRYKLTYNKDHTGYVHTAPLVLIGDGPSSTILDIYPKTLGASVANGGTQPDFAIVRNTAGAATFKARGLRVEGPTASSVPGWDTVARCSFYLQQANAMKGNTVELDDIEIIGAAMQGGIGLWNAEGRVRCRNLRIDLLGVGICWFGDRGTSEKYLDLIDCDVKAGVAAEHTTGNGGQPYGVGVYVHPQVSVNVRGTHFHDCPRDAIKNFSGGGPSAFPAPHWTIYQGATFLRCGWSIITPGMEGVTQIRGCAFLASPLAVRNDAAISHCVFSESPITTTVTGKVTTWSTTIDGCDCHTNTPGVTLIDTLSGSKTVRNTRLRFGSACNATNRGAHVNTEARSRIEGCRAESAVAAGGPVAFSYLVASGTHTLARSDATGAFSYAVSFQPTAGSGIALTVEDNDFSALTSAAGGAWLHTNSGNSAWKDMLIAGGNRLNGSAPDSGGVGITSVIRPRRGYLATPIASAASVVLDPSYDEFRISGTTTINNLYFPGNDVTNYAGAVRLIADGAWSTSASGNIRPATTAARTAGKVYTFYLDHSTGLWIE